MLRTTGLFHGIQLVVTLCSAASGVGRWGPYTRPPLHSPRTRLAAWTAGSSGLAVWRIPAELPLGLRPCGDLLRGFASPAGDRRAERASSAGIRASTSEGFGGMPKGAHPLGHTEVPLGDAVSGVSRFEQRWRLSGDSLTRKSISPRCD